MRYVCGFMFTPDMKAVALIKKERPDWQKGHYNGIGGKVEEGETFRQAMIREFEEEAGVHFEDWQFFLSLKFKGGEVAFFYAITPKYFDIVSQTDEIIMMENVGALPRLKVIPNLRWIIPMALSLEQGEHAEGFVVSEVYDGVPCQ